MFYSEQNHKLKEKQIFQGKTFKIVKELEWRKKTTNAATNKEQQRIVTLVHPRSHFQIHFQIRWLSFSEESANTNNLFDFLCDSCNGESKSTNSSTPSSSN